MLFNSFLSVSAFISTASASFGSHWALNPRDEKAARILRASTTVQVPQIPSPQVDTLFIWPGMDTAFGGVVQSLLISSAPGDGHPWSCDAKAGQWCTETFLRYGRLGFDGSGVAVDQGDMLTFDYLYDAPSDRYTQTISKNGVVLTSFKSYSGGFAFNWYLQTECHYLATGPTPASTWSNTTIELAFAQPKFANTLHTNHSTNSPITSVDGGKTWSIESITLEAYDCYPHFDDTSATGGNSSIVNVTSTITGTLATTMMPTSTLTGSAASATAAATTGASTLSDSTIIVSASGASTAAGTSTSAVTTTATSTTAVPSGGADTNAPMTGIGYLLAISITALVQYL